MATTPGKPATPTVSTEPVSTDEKPLPGALMRLRKYPADSQRPELVLCCSENAYDLVLSSSAGGAIIFSEMLEVSETKNFAGGLGIYVHRLLAPMPKEGQPNETVVLSCNGDMGADYGLAADAKSGNPGKPAWNMNVYVEECSSSSFDCIEFAARGGKGGNGRDGLLDTDKPLTGTGTAGADGGNGGKIRLLLGTVISRAVLLARSILDARVDAANDVNEAQKLFGDHITALGNFIDFCRSIILELLDAEFKLQLSTLEVLLTYSWIEYPLQQERAILRGILATLGAAADDLCLQVRQKVDVSGGIWGVGGNGALNRSASGKNGLPGTATIDFNILIPRSTCQRALPFAHPDQCSMLLETAKSYYFQASLVRAPPKTNDKNPAPVRNKPLEQCYITLSRLQNRLLFLDFLKPEDPLYMAYRDSEYNMRIMPRADKEPAADISAIATLKDIQNTADLMLRQISAQVDFYGHPPGYVPRASHKFYSTLLDPLLGILEVAETAHLNYFQKSTKAEQRKQAINDIESQIEKGISEHERAVVKLKKFMTTQIELAKMLHTKMKDAQENLQENLRSIAKELSSLSPWPGLSLMDFVEAATCICFCPNPAMFGVQTAGLLVKGFTNAGIRDAEGEYVDKTLLVEKIKTIEGDADSIVAALQEVKSSGSKLSLDDPSATKLVVKKEEVMKLFKGFKNKFEEKQLKDLDSSFQKYIDVTTERNTAILLYNSAFDSWLQTQDSIRYLRGKKGDVQTTINSSDPDLAAVALYMERSYKETLRYVLEIFYLAQKSLWFWSLENRNYLGEKLESNVVTNMTYEVLKGLKATIIQELQKNTENHGKDMQKFVGLKLSLNESQLLDLKTNGKTIVRVPTNSTGMNGKGFCFKDMNGVRLTKVRFFVPGATSTTNIVRITLLHMGQESIVDASGKEHDFQHEKIRTHFQHRIDLAPNFPENTNGTIDGDIGKETGSEYALVGPFTTWHIEIESPDDEAVVTWNNIKEAYFSFHGLYYP